MTVLLLAGCQTQRAKIASLWSSDEVVEETTDALYNDVSYVDDANMNKASYQITETTSIEHDKNKLLTLTDVSGNREYLILDSIAQERGIITALIEFRYAKPQTLPANGMIYHYNQWREQIDCKNKVRILRVTTHYNAAGEVVDTRDYPLPKYKPAELAALSQANDKVIQHVCERVGKQGLAVGDATIVSDTPAPSTEAVPAKDKKPQKTNKTSKTNETHIKVEEKIDFIGKGKSVTTPIQAASDVAAPSENQLPDPKSNQQSNKKDSTTHQKQETLPTQAIENQTIEVNKIIEIPTDPTKTPQQIEGEIQLKPI